MVYYIVRTFYEHRETPSSQFLTVSSALYFFNAYYFNYFETNFQYDFPALLSANFLD